MAIAEQIPATSALAVDDLPSAVEMHRRLLPHGFLVELGDHALRQYYVQYLRSPHGYARAVRLDGQLVGVIVGVLDSRGHSAWASNQVPSMAVAIAHDLVRRPRLLGTFVRSRLLRYLRAAATRLAHRLRGRSPRLEPAKAVTAVLSHVYVSEAARGLGLGGELVDGFVAAARSAGASRGRLMTLAGPGGAGPFYARRGWRREAPVSELDGRRFETWTIDLHGAPQPDDTASGRVRP